MPQRFVESPFLGLVLGLVLGWALGGAAMDIRAQRSVGSAADLSDEMENWVNDPIKEQNPDVWMEQFGPPTLIHENRFSSLGCWEFHMEYPWQADLLEYQSWAQYRIAFCYNLKNYRLEFSNYGEPFPSQKAFEDHQP